MKPAIVRRFNAELAFSFQPLLLRSSLKITSRFSFTLSSKLAEESNGDGSELRQAQPERQNWEVIIRLLLKRR